MHLNIGEGLATTRPALISTVLGSCVSAAFFHPGSGLAAIFHALLPTGPKESYADSPCRFVDRAVPVMLKKFSGIKTSEIQVKLFGGAFTLNQPGRGPDAEILDMGAENVSQARKSLRACGLKVMVENVQGGLGRKILFNTENGDVWMRFLCAAPQAWNLDQGRNTSRPALPADSLKNIYP